MRLVGTIASIACLSLSLHAQETSSRQQILAASQTWWNAFLQSDADLMATIETEDFFLINNGIPTDKSRLAAIRGRTPIQRKQTIDVLKFEDFGTVATISGFVNMDAAGQPPGRFPFSEVWVRQGSNWRIKSAHYGRTTPVDPANGPHFTAASKIDPELKKALEARNAALKARDAAAWGRIATNDHLTITGNGFQQDRATRMAALSQPGVIQGEVEPEFRSYGEHTVIYTHRTGNPGMAQTLVSEVWIKGATGWLLAHRQVTLR